MKSKHLNYNHMQEIEGSIAEYIENNSPYAGKRSTHGVADAGSDHYKNFWCEPAIFSEKNGFSFLTGDIVKRATRINVKQREGDFEKVREDLKKIKDTCEILERIYRGDFD